MKLTHETTVKTYKLTFEELKKKFNIDADELVEAECHNISEEAIYITVSKHTQIKSRLFKPRHKGQEV